MAISEQQRQKKLAKKKQKRKDVVKKPSSVMQKARSYANCPIHQCLIPENLFTIGAGELIVTRRTPQGALAMSAFAIDVFCLGVKEAMFAVVPEVQYEQNIKPRMAEVASARFENLEPSCAKKLLDGAVEYAQALGFDPHPDYKNAYELVAAIETDACAEQYAYGKDGQPCYIKGPYESLTDSRRIIDTLIEKCGVDGFTSLVELDEGDAE